MANMTFRVILESEGLNDVSKQCSCARPAPTSKQSLSHDGELLGVVKSPRCGLRHSLHATCDTQESKSCFSRRVRRQSVAPLSHGSCRRSSPSHPKKSGSSTSTTVSKPIAKNQTSPRLVSKRCSLPHQRNCSVNRSRVKLLLSEARHVIALRTDKQQKLSIMDVILDAQSPGTDLDHDALIEAIRRIQELSYPTRYQYHFTDELSLAIYWADEAARSGTHAVEEIKTRFPDSDERSTTFCDKEKFDQETALFMMAHGG